MRDQYRRFSFRNSPPPEAERGYTPQDETVEVSQGTALDSARNTAQSVGRVGNRVQAGNLPQPVFEAPIAFSFLKDLIPDVSGKLGVNVEAPEYKAAGLSLQTNYVSTRPEEVVNPGATTPPNVVGMAPFRDHRLWVEWGSGTSVLQGEIDTGQGNQMNVSGANVRAMLVDWSYSRVSTQYTYQRLTTDLVLSAFTNPGQGYCTTRVCAPYQIAVDLGNPPTIAELKEQLSRACSFREYQI